MKIKDVKSFYLTYRKFILFALGLREFGDEKSLIKTPDKDKKNA